MDENSGWIKLSRKLLQTNYYLGEKFTKAMCWIDLLLLAEWRKERSFYLRGIEVVVKRGQIAMALADLHKRWNLSINTVQARLREMVKDGRISVKSSNVVTIITILNWEKYQGEKIRSPVRRKLYCRRRRQFLRLMPPYLKLSLLKKLRKLRLLLSFLLRSHKQSQRYYPYQSLRNLMWIANLYCAFTMTVAPHFQKC